MKHSAQTFAYFAPLIASMLLGCAVGPDYTSIPPNKIVAGLAATDQTDAWATATGHWWTHFNDAGLTTLVEASLKHSPDIESADASIRQARASAQIVSTVNSVQLDAQGRAGRDHFSKNSENFANIPFPNPKTSFDDYHGGFDVSWEIDLFGHTARGVEAANARVAGIEAQRSDVALRVSGETARNVLEYRYMQLRIANAELALKDNQSLLHLVQLQRAAGVATDLDVKQAEIAVQNAGGILPPMQSAKQASAAALMPLTGMTREQIASVLDPVSPVPDLPMASQFAVDSAVLTRRPDVRMAERALASASAEIGVAMADQYPRFNLVGDGGWDSVTAGKFSQQASRFWNFGPQLYVPILNGGRVNAEIRQNIAARDAAMANYRKSILSALADTESVMLRCQGDRGNLDKTKVALDLQSVKVDLTDKRVKVGEAPQMDLLNARLQQRALHDQQWVLQLALSEDYVLLYKALGGDATGQSTGTGK